MLDNEIITLEMTQYQFDIIRIASKILKFDMKEFIIASALREASEVLDEK
jgi:uncharacterized protein (DUF1778 family)